MTNGSSPWKPIMHTTIRYKDRLPLQVRTCVTLWSYLLVRYIVTQRIQYNQTFQNHCFIKLSHFISAWWVSTKAGLGKIFSFSYLVRLSYPSPPLHFHCGKSIGLKYSVESHPSLSLISSMLKFWLRGTTVAFHFLFFLHKLSTISFQSTSSFVILT